MESVWKAVVSYVSRAVDGDCVNGEHVKGDTMVGNSVTAYRLLVSIASLSRLHYNTVVETMQWWSLVDRVAFVYRHADVELAERWLLGERWYAMVHDRSAPPPVVARTYGVHYRVYCDIVDKVWPLMRQVARLPPSSDTRFRALMGARSSVHFLAWAFPCTCDAQHRVHLGLFDFEGVCIADARTVFDRFMVSLELEYLLEHPRAMATDHTAACRLAVVYWVAEFHYRVDVLEALSRHWTPYPCRFVPYQTIRCTFVDLGPPRALAYTRWVHFLLDHHLLFDEYDAVLEHQVRREWLTEGLGVAPRIRAILHHTLYPDEDSGDGGRPGQDCQDDQHSINIDDETHPVDTEPMPVVLGPHSTTSGDYG
jgi:hypothetical protein